MVTQMKFLILLTLIGSIFVSANAQDDQLLTIPKIEDVKRITVQPAIRNWYKPDSLLKLLPKFVPGGGYKTKMLLQYGTIKLKNGKVLNWRADSNKTLVLYVRNEEKYFYIPADTTMNQKSDDTAARDLIADQPDFTADSSCVKYENTGGQGFGESLKSAKKGDWYRHESPKFIDYFVPREPPLRYSFKNKKYEPFTGDTENHLWFFTIESPALLALDKSLKFEIVGRKTVAFGFAGRTEKREQIKIKVSGQTTIGGDLDKTVAFLYVMPSLRNLVVKTELIFPKGGKNCTLRNISFNVPDGLFTDFFEYRTKKLLTLPKAEDIARIEISKTSAIDWYKPDQLLKLLPEFEASEGTYVSKQPFQYGTFVLKNGERIKWIAGGKDSILLSEGSREQLFKIPRFKVK